MKEKDNKEKRSDLDTASERIGELELLVYQLEERLYQAQNVNDLLQADVLQLQREKAEMSKQHQRAIQQLING